MITVDQLKNLLKDSEARLKGTIIIENEPSSSNLGYTGITGSPFGLCANTVPAKISAQTIIVSFFIFSVVFS